MKRILQPQVLLAQLTLSLGAALALHHLSRQSFWPSFFACECALLLTATLGGLLSSPEEAEIREKDPEP